MTLWRSISQAVLVICIGATLGLPSSLISVTLMAKSAFAQTDNGGSPDGPSFPDGPDGPNFPETPESPETPEFPENPETPEFPETPEVPATPPGLEDLNQPDPNDLLPNDPGGGSRVPPSFSDPTQIIERVEVYNSLPYAEYFGLNLYGELMPLADISLTLNKLGKRTGTKPALVYVISTPRGLALVLVLPQEEVDPTAASPSLWASRAERSGLTQTGTGQTTPSNLRFQMISDAKPRTLKRLTRTFRQEVSDPEKLGTTSYQNSAKRLYDWMIAPLQPTLTENEIDTLIFSMDRGLRSLPVAALFDGQQFLVEQYNLALIPSFSLTDTRYSPIQNTRMLGMGISAATGGLTSLPAVDVEVPTLTDRLWNGQGYLNQQSTLENFRALTEQERFSIIHLATHASFNAGNVNQSYIQFWDGRLTLPELRELALSQKWNAAPNIEMLVLSACQTALGNDQAELGFTGLAVQTGVKTAIGSLWFVSDAGSLGFMSEFYRQLQSAPIRAAGVREAQTAMLRGQVKVVEGQLQLGDGTRVDLPEAIAPTKNLDLSHPYYWSAYTVIGNWN